MPGIGGQGATATGAVFLNSEDWPGCSEDPPGDLTAGCCFQPAGSVAEGLNAGVVTVSFSTEDGGGGSISLPYLSDGGGRYFSNHLPALDGIEFGLQGGELGEPVLPAFLIDLGHYFEGPTPELTPGLDQLTSLSTTQDWTVPLTPSQLEFGFVDRVVIEADGVGSIVCQCFDEGVLRPGLVVPSALLSNFGGHTGTVTVTRDDYRGWLDAGEMWVAFRAGVEVQTAPNAVSFTP